MLGRMPLNGLRSDQEPPVPVLALHICVPRAGVPRQAGLLPASLRKRASWRSACSCGQGVLVFETQVVRGSGMEQPCSSEGEGSPVWWHLPEALLVTPGMNRLLPQIYKEGPGRAADPSSRPDLLPSHEAQRPTLGARLGGQQLWLPPVFASMSLPPRLVPLLPGQSALLTPAP